MTIWTIFGLSTHSIGEKPEIVGKLLSNDEEWRNWNLNSAYLQTTCFCQLLDVDGWGFLLEAICLLKRGMTSLSKIFQDQGQVFSLFTCPPFWSFWYSLVSACWSFVDVLLSKVPMQIRQISSASFIWRKFFWKVLYCLLKNKFEFNVNQYCV